eukprot:626743-Pyramimonas_sp.AAC.1
MGLELRLRAEGTVADLFIATVAVPPTCFSVLVRLLSGKHVVLAVVDCDTIGSMKMQIYDKTGIPPQYQRLVLSGREVDDFQTLLYYTVRRDSVFYLTAGLRGGMDAGVQSSGARAASPEAACGSDAPVQF